jgi:hypothetical protein
MPHGLIIGLFVLILAPLVVIVLWEIKRARIAPHSVSRACKYLETQGSARPAKETKRGFDSWD